eukprot:TRINITY_DN3509_c0_g1_i2.p1 TRINITY_DN3509_c0_g1~~TRINITY_DN3509_c0_g1_i2.p1  ORF type:complete len:474 (-),score=88.81 TRINITY_DN3509_c0_g1_i2:2557-3936(-)
MARVPVGPTAVILVVLLLAEQRSTAAFAGVRQRGSARPSRCWTLSGADACGDAPGLDRRTVLAAAAGAGGVFSGLFGGGAANAAGLSKVAPKGKTNEVVRTVNGIRHRRCGGGDIIVSEVGLGTQRWVSEDFNAPDEALCHQMMDRAILEGGVNLIDTAEQYPIPSSRRRPEGLAEEVIGRWINKAPGRREKVVIASKITGGSNVNAANIAADFEGSLQRLGTDYMDLYLLHWPARYTPQANWGQSLAYHQEAERFYRGHASFEEIAEAMGKLVKQGRIRGWGICNDNAYGLAAQSAAARQLGVEPPCVMQGDFSLINRRSAENGMFEGCSPINENVGFLGYNVLGGGVLTGKYLDTPAAADLPTESAIKERLKAPRGRHDDRGWGPTLYRYRSGPAAEATKAYAALARQAGLTPTQMALRWCKQQTGLTSALLGTSNMDQLNEGLKCFAEPKLLSDVS